MKRFGYRKSRTGCLRCKQRRVKSDSGSSCISCVQLMHHYTAIAHRTLLTPCSHACAALQHAVPQEAFIYPSLLHQILAFSALNLAYIHPNKRQQYLIQASQHQSMAVSGTRELLAEPVAPDSCHALYASSIFLMISGYGIFPSCENGNPNFEPIGGLVDIFVLVGGMSVILESYDTQLRQGPLRGLFRDCACPLPQVKEQIHDMAAKLATLIPLLEETSELHQDERKTLVEAAILLMDVIESAKHTKQTLATPEIRAVFSWPARLSTAYLTLTRQHHPLAMVVLSFFCVLLNAREDNYWFLHGWAAILLKSIARIVVDSPWKEMIQWPIDTVGDVNVEV
ncbi:hypothetical protein EDB81DRAFT_700484 [Dactylonectria macrodidyma]|uniref:Zn(2)-C6 fungal-type domain-containing protein n=1 Tax=Dactylonectria macrodidyma TaxID=307937 RepID=A0A9P9IGY3_9HYPO|nr:hypothetical protein EDB81DRAFT_700484 [Dactylonectria macrodidyma]